ncbi:hypothetical protein N4T57_01815 [Campylobacter hepaticus]|uniref:Uncharacterized protein n=2 Tax=Campylobacter hepaticus TaxID=1813019 RepID=A0A424YZB0_9BACT|nr:hypothetical protein [Campylobacter hepaticus]AXP09049.1 hypothetical protein A2J15_004960 [Campylobacter hepaticus]MCZ0771903.1 hypothetical protein [Campylobacter hepaticus]MCZ0773372.1 hypothetical protein [Campylobacter hepaticus]MCZ0774623.1 hypothetical protein [Campylobacter hepaticus]MDX2323967.1 hypothetical protein [Campylobacter hepaticus]
MDKKILEFIKSERLLSWAMIDEIGVYIANAFYAFDEENLAFIIASHEHTKHIKLTSQNPNIALNIAKDNKIAFLKGIQAKAEFKIASKEQIKIYFSRFPFARLDKSAKIYALELFWLKFTDNALKLSKKLEFYKK